MVKQKVTRKLVAILAADVVGYSRLIGQDEEGTIARLKDLREELIDPSIARYDGRIVKTMGDGVLVEFPSVVDAVRNAVEVQRALAKREADVPEDRRIIFRIGVNLGDIVIDGDDILGDGVNVAARLEGLADPGSICISGDVFRQVEGKLDLAFADAGEHELKNIARPISVWRWTGAGAAMPAEAEPPTLELPDKPSIAVLAFDNLSGDPEQDYFSDGIAEDIITALSKISGLLVIARNSSFTYKGRAVKVQEIGKDLGVRSVLEGSVRKAGNRVRITAQLVDCTTGGHLWAERFDRDLTDIFAVQDEVTHEIVSALTVNLTPDERQRLVQKGTDNIDAYDCFLRGREQYSRLTKEGNTQGQVMFRLAIELDPRFAPAYAQLALTRIMDHVNQWGDPADHPLDEAHELARRAVALDDSDPAGHAALNSVYLWTRQHDKAIAEGEKTIALDPNFAFGKMLLGRTLHYVGRSEEAIAHIHRAMRLDPHHNDIWFHFLAQAHFQLGHYDEAIALLKRRLIRSPETDVSRVLLASSYGHQGRVEEAQVLWEELFRVNPDYSLEHSRRILPYKNPSAFERVVEGLRKAGLPK